MMFGAVGGAIAGAMQASKAEKAGGHLVREYHLEDPMPKVKQAFVGNLVHEHSFQNIRSLDDVLANDNVDALKKKFEKDCSLTLRRLPGHSAWPAHLVEIRIVLSMQGGSA